MSASKRYTWRRGKDRDGMMRLAPSYSLHRGSDEVIARVQEHRTGGWYWYGLGQNTAHDLKPLAEAQADALAFVKAHATKVG